MRLKVVEIQALIRMKKELIERQRSLFSFPRIDYRGYFLVNTVLSHCRQTSGYLL